MSQPAPSAIGVIVNRQIGRFTRALVDVAGVVLLLLMLLTVADVAMRYLFNAPISGVWDITQMAMVTVTFMGFAFSGHVGGHIVIELIKGVSAGTLRRLDIMSDLVSAAVMLTIAWRSALYAVDVATTGAASMTLLVPFYPLVAIVAFGSLMFALVLVANAIWPDASPARGAPPPA